jgi:cytochrome c peroxidase
MNNAAPVPARPGGPVLMPGGIPINYDATQGGKAFRDLDGDPITYELEMLSPDLGLVIQGTQVLGTFAGAGVVNFKLVARDGYGGEAEQRFSLAVAAPEPGRPILPPVSYVYEDALLPLPAHVTRAGLEPLGDTEHPANQITNAGATLGRVLFYDKRLSITNTHSCASCHAQEHGFSTPERFPLGVANVPMERNAMGLTNVRYNFSNRFFADERVESLESLVTMPIEDPDELGNTLKLLEAKLTTTDFYPPLFQAAFGSPAITRDRIAKALAQFLRSIVSYQTKFDAALPSTFRTVYTREEFSGEQHFDLARCDSCHATAVHAMSTARNNGLDAVPADPGAGDGRFRAASLRNVAMTAPYMHDGRFATLREVIDHYDHGVVDTPHLDTLLRAPGGAVRTSGMNEYTKAALEAFLHTLTDQAVLTDPRWSDPFPY